MKLSNDKLKAMLLGDDENRSGDQRDELDRNGPEPDRLFSEHPQEHLGLCHVAFLGAAALLRNVA